MGWQLIGHWRLPDRYKLLALAHEDHNTLPSKFRRKVVPKIWYFLVNAGAVHFLPFLGIYWRHKLGFTTQQIGLLQALRPWVSAASGNLLTPLADKWNLHHPMLIVTYAIVMISRGLITLPFNFGIMLALALIMEAVVSPMSILVDATVVAGSTKDGTYGRARLWASVGWGALAPIAGVILLKFGIHTVFMVFVVIYSLAFIPTLLMPARLLNGAGQKLIAELPSPSDSSTSDQQLDALEVPVQPPGSEKEKVNATTAAGGVAVDAGKRLNDAVVIVGLQEKAVEGVVAVSTAVRTPPGGLSRRTTAVHSAPPVPGEQAQGREALPQSTQSTDPCMDLPASVEKRKSQGQAQEQAPTVSLVADGRAMHHSTVPEIIVLAGTPDDVKGLTGAQVTVKGEDTDLKGKAIASEGCDGNGGAPGAHLDLVHAVSMDAQSRSVWQGLKPLLKDVCVLAFFFKALLMGAGNGFIGYLFLVLTDLGANGLLLGFCLTLNSCGEVPVFYFSGAIIKRIGIDTSFNIAMGAFVLRLGCYGLLKYFPSLWIVLAVEILQGLTFALAYSAGVVHCRRIAPKHMRSTVQSIFSGLYSGVGAGIGGLAGGMLIYSYGDQVMFFAAAISIVIGWAMADAAYLMAQFRRGFKASMRGVQSMSYLAKISNVPPP